MRCSTVLHVYLLSSRHSPLLLSSFFFFNATAPTELYTLSLHDALPISAHVQRPPIFTPSFPVFLETVFPLRCSLTRGCTVLDRKSTRLNSSHVSISYAVFCLKKKKKKKKVYIIIAYNTYRNNSTIDYV